MEREPPCDTAAAHTVRSNDGLRLHALDEHLREVARRAAHDAAPFQGAPWARLAGLWHDLGKYRPGFQRYLRAASAAEAEDAHIEGGAGRVNHSTAGALLACERFGIPGRVLAYLIAGHHAGLYDWHSDSSSLEARLASDAGRAELAEARAEAPAAVLDDGGFVPDLQAVPGGSAGFALWLRMLFSALVDADFLDTEAFMDQGKAASRGAWPPLATLRASFDAYMAQLAAQAPDTPVNRLRARILAQCRAKAAQPPGHFSLTVPTGGGKTLPMGDGKNAIQGIFRLASAWYTPMSGLRESKHFVLAARWGLLTWTGKRRINQRFLCEQGEPGRHCIALELIHADYRGRCSADVHQ